MTELNTYWRSVVETLRNHKLQFRIKWTGDAEMTDWQPWVICPTDGYMETGRLGPMSVRDIEWLDVSLLDRDGNGQLTDTAQLLAENGVIFKCKQDSLRITFDD